jgi:hypothetical protein
MENDNVGQNALLIFLEVCKPKLFRVRSFESVYVCVCVFVNIWTTCVYGFISKGGVGWGCGGGVAMSCEMVSL